MSIKYHTSNIDSKRHADVHFFAFGDTKLLNIRAQYGLKVDKVSSDNSSDNSFRADDCLK